MMLLLSNLEACVRSAEASKVLAGKLSVMTDDSITNTDRVPEDTASRIDERKPEPN